MTGVPTGWRKSSRSAQQVTCVEVGRVAETWRKSSRSTNTDNCVEIVPATCGAAVRDSKDREAGYFTTTAHQWRLFVTAVKAGRFES
ncbi:DUF397 domain-containing protein [Saccharopolyspora sp. NPDC000359]|uniref:DUF397 domain-containing protein n=1 Tax=Saccharopolyspora sp. NPDC000359 TaxID=3154251 RepID=UPI0033343133